jgi:Saxitoxin biosynthesis operon protein SxtJ
VPQAQDDRSRSAGSLRRFGLSVGGVFLLLAALSWWRGHTLAPRVLATVGVLLVAPALVVPALLAPVERLWMGAAAVLGAVNTRIILALAYYLILTPIGVVLRWFHDPLNRRLDDGAASNWTPRQVEPVDPARYRHQF